MRIAIDDLENYVPQMIWERGLDYYKNGAITELEEVAPGEWVAVVEGSEYYNVEVSLNGDDIESWECDCPYDYGSICKHVVAVLLAIRDEKKKVKSSAFNIEANRCNDSKSQPEKSAIDKDVKEILFDDMMKLAKTEDLRAFVEAYAMSDEAFRLSFIDYIRQKYLRKDEKRQKDYIKEVTKIFREAVVYDKSRRYYNLDDVTDWITIAYKMEKVFEDAAILLKNGDTVNPAKIVLHFFELVSEYVDDTIYYEDDSQYEMNEICEKAGELLLKVVNEDSVASFLKQEIFKRIREVAKEHCVNDYVGYDVGDLMFALGEFVQTPEERLMIIDEKIKEWTEKGYGLYQYVQKKIDYLKELNRVDEALDVEEKYLYLSEIRKKRVETLRSSKKYDEAIKMLDEGIVIANEKRNYRTVTQWMEMKLDIFELQNNNQEVIAMCRTLFISKDGTMDYYKKLKNRVPSTDWKAFLCKMISELKYKGDVVGDIYEAEKDYDELLRWIVSEKYNRIRHTLGYGFRMPEKYHPALLDIFASDIKAYAEDRNNMNRESYWEITQRLKEAKKLSGGEAMVNRIVAEFRIVYKRRPAMMDELSKL